MFQLSKRIVILMVILLAFCMSTSGCRDNVNDIEQTVNADNDAKQNRLLLGEGLSVQDQDIHLPYVKEGVFYDCFDKSLIDKPLLNEPIISDVDSYYVYRRFGEPKYISVLILQKSRALWEYFPYSSSLIKLSDNVVSYTNIGGDSLFVKDDGSLWIFEEDDKFTDDCFEDSVSNKEDISASLVKLSDNVKCVFGDGWVPGILFKKNDDSLWFVDHSRYNSTKKEVYCHYKVRKISENVKFAKMASVGRDGGVIYYIDSDDKLWKCKGFPVWSTKQKGLDRNKVTEYNDQPEDKDYITDNCRSVSWYADYDMGDSGEAYIIKNDGSLFKYDIHGRLKMLCNDLNVNTVCGGKFKFNYKYFTDDVTLQFLYIIDSDSSLWKISSKGTKKLLFEGVKQFCAADGFERNSVAYDKDELVLLNDGRLLKLDGTEITDSVNEIFRENFVVKNDGVYSLYNGKGRLRGKPLRIIEN